MDLREQRGMELAATRTIRRDGTGWIVPSQTGKGTYRVNHAAHRHPECTCPDYETRGGKCKHIYAAIVVMRRELNADGSITVTQGVVLTATKETTYPQAWVAYNSAQTNEKDKFQTLLRDLCRGIQELHTQKRGRITLPLSDAVYSVKLQVYTTVIVRRVMSACPE